MGRPTVNYAGETGTNYTKYEKNKRVRTALSKSEAYKDLGDGWAFIISFSRWFPDFLLDTFRAEDAEYELTLIQRVIIRAKARYQYCDITGCRGLTKSYCSIIEEHAEMLLYPGQITAYYGPSHEQTSSIGGQIFKQIAREYPGLADHFLVYESKGKLTTRTILGSEFTIAAFRGASTHKTVAEEAAQEEQPIFDWEEYRRVVLPVVRLRYTINGKRSRTYIPYKQHMITSAGRRQNEAYETRCRHKQMMQRGESAFVMDIPYDVVLLSLMRPTAWADSLKGELAPDEWAREMESRYAGADKNPVIPDSTLTESRSLLLMEEHHCCKDFGNKTLPENVFYIVGYDVSYADGKDNAKCACVVIKCTRQKEHIKRDKYLKQVVWVDDWLPMDAMAQADKLKKVWHRYCVEGSTAYISMDAWQYGSSVLQALMMDLEDGMAPLCTYGHTLYTEYELSGSIPIIYPIKAGGAGTTDPDAEMIRYAEVQFDNRNVQLLTSNYNDGIESYKSMHRIQEDKYDYVIYNPYKKTNELIGQIQNLRKVQNSNGVSEKRISRRIQRDSWSALKYALRMAQILERTNLQRVERHSDWDKEIKRFKTGTTQSNSMTVLLQNAGEETSSTGRIPFRRTGGRGAYGD